MRLPWTDDLLVGEGLLDLAQVLVAGAEQAGHEVVAGDEALGAQGGGHAVGHVAVQVSVAAVRPRARGDGGAGTEFMASGPMLKTSR